jgi:hypothetical protein
MIRTQHILVLALATSLLAGCGTFKKLTGKNDNTVLPGERENVLPPEEQVNQRPGQSDDLAAPPQEATDAACDPSADPSCGQGTLDQEAPGEPQ